MTGRFRVPQIATGLSARLLLLTVVFVMLGELLIYMPSVANYWRSYLGERLSIAHLAALALEATPNYMVSPDLSRELLDHADAHLVVLFDPDGGRRFLAVTTPPAIDHMVDVESLSWSEVLRETFVTLTRGGNRVLRVIGPSPKNPSILVEVVFDEAPMREAMLAFSWNILELSLVISAMTAGLVFFALQWMMVRPVRRLTQAMTAFHEAPEDPSREIRPSRRRDEIGVAEKELLVMQRGLRAALMQKARLASLGGAMTRINHDLRNILATASLLSDRISQSSDPDVRRVAPTLISAIDRAVTLCVRTLDFARTNTPGVDVSAFRLGSFIEEVAAAAEAQGSSVNGQACRVWREVPDGLILRADRQQLDRVVTNLLSNAVQAGAHEIRIDAARRNGHVVIDVADDGPGLSDAARKSLFEPFAGSTRRGGSGLGLAIAREIMTAHGGTIDLVGTGPTGTVFRLTLPAEDA